MSSMNMYRLVRGPEGKTTTDEILDRGWESIYVAVSVLRLCDHDRGQALYRLLVGEIQVKSASGYIIMTEGQTRRIIELLEGIEDRIKAVTVKGHDLTDEKAIEALALDPPVAEKNDLDDDSAGYNLSNALVRALLVRDFLEQALKMGAFVALE